MKKLILALVAFVTFSILSCHAKSNYRLEAIEGQLIQFFYAPTNNWPVIFDAIILDSDSLNIETTDYDNIVDNIFKVAKFIPETNSSLYSAFEMMFKTDMDPKHSPEKLRMEINYITDKYENQKKIPIEGGTLIMSFVNIQAIVMITQKDNVNGVDSSVGIEYEKIPEEV